MLWRICHQFQGLNIINNLECLGIGLFIYVPVNNFSVTSGKTFCGFSMGSNQYWAGRVYDLCFYFMTGTPEGLNESGLMEKPGIEPAIPGLQDIGLSPTPRRLHKTFSGFSMGSNQFWAGRVYGCVCVFYDGNSRRLNRKFFLWRSQGSNLRPLVYKT